MVAETLDVVWDGVLGTYVRLRPYATGAINIEPDSVTSEPIIEMTQNLQESLTISPVCMKHARTSQRGSYPTGNIEAIPVLTPRGNA
jgi:hypothetical protein